MVLDPLAPGVTSQGIRLHRATRGFPSFDANLPILALGFQWTMDPPLGDGLMSSQAIGPMLVRPIPIVLFSPYYILMVIALEAG